jgi:plastocyanin
VNRFRPLVFVLALSVPLALVPVFGAGASIQAGACAPAWGTVSSANNPDWDQNSLRGVSARSDTNVLAVGISQSNVSGDAATLGEQWDGAHWNLVPTASPGNEASLNDVHFVNSGDAWAVGETYTGTYWQSLVERWTGAGFVRVASPNAHTSANSTNDLKDVGGAADDAWAVGSTTAGLGLVRPFILHFDGSTWSKTAVPANPGSSDYSLAGVTRLTSSPAWAVGSFFNGSRDVPMVLRWNGTSWSVVSGVPKPGTGNARLVAVREFSSTNVWAVGFVVEAGGTHTLVMHYDGSSWKRVSSPNGFGSNSLEGIAGRTGHDIWAVGSADNTGQGGLEATLILHYDGHSWRQVSSPSPSAKFDSLSAVATVSGGSNVWAVGSTRQTLAARICPIRLSDTEFSPDSSKVDMGDTVAWVFPAANTEGHTVTDASGLGLFDSGQRLAGGSYTHTFDASGTYAIQDLTTGLTSKIQVAVDVSPTHGGASSTFVVFWATKDASAPLAYDVQVKGPSDGSYLTWQSGVTVDGGDFVPNQWQGGEGAGTYRFRARLRNANTGAVTDWSPAAKITVT